MENDKTVHGLLKAILNLPTALCIKVHTVLTLSI